MEYLLQADLKKCRSYDHYTSVTPGQAAEHASGGARCSYCGADVTGKKFCTECGGRVG